MAVDSTRVIPAFEPMVAPQGRNGKGDAEMLFVDFFFFNNWPLSIKAGVLLNAVRRSDKSCPGDS